MELGQACLQVDVNLSALTGNLYRRELLERPCLVWEARVVRQEPDQASELQRAEGMSGDHSAGETAVEPSCHYVVDQPGGSVRVVSSSTSVIDPDAAYSSVFTSQGDHNG